jgi:hypothetical protein
VLLLSTAKKPEFDSKLHENYLIYFLITPLAEDPKMSTSISLSTFLRLTLFAAWVRRISGTSFLFLLDEVISLLDFLFLELVVVSLIFLRQLDGLFFLLFITGEE